MKHIKYEQFLNEENIFKKAYNSITSYIEKIKENNRLRAEERKRQEEERLEKEEEEERKNREHEEYHQRLMDTIQRNYDQQLEINIRLNRLLMKLRDDFITYRNHPVTSRIDVKGSDGIGYIGQKMEYTMQDGEKAILIYVPGSRMKSKLYHIKRYETIEFDIIPINANNFINIFNEMNRY
jgi:hypothetical protein